MFLCFVGSIAREGSMEDILAQILHGCELAADIRANLVNLASQPHLLLSSCEDVANSFNRAINGLRSHASQQHQMGLAIAEESTSHGFLLQGLPANVVAPAGQGFGMPAVSLGGMIAFGAGAGETKTSVRRGREGSGVAAGSSSGSGKRSGESSAQGSSRKRKDSEGARTVLAPAPLTGNTEIPPDDGYTWRKYGQKDILRSQFPRSYYRCTHKNFYGCRAKKQVQRLDNDPFTYEVTYCGDHTCQTSTAPLMIPVVPPPTETNPSAEPIFPEISQSPPSLSTSIQLSSWFSREVETTGRGPAGPSENPGGRDADWPVADMADAMFNSGSSGSSMDAIFPSKQQGWKDKNE